MLLEDRIQKECAPCENKLRPTPAVSECAQNSTKHSNSLFLVLLIGDIQTSHQISISLSE